MTLESRLLITTRGDLPSAYDVFPDADYSSNQTKTVTELFRIHGDVYVKYLELTLQIEKIREACNRALSPSINDPARTWILRLASYKMGARKCDELATAYLLKCIVTKIPVVRIQTMSEDRNADHVFLITGREAERITKAGSIERMMESLSHKECKIVDPYLNCIVPTELYSGSILQEYLSKCGIVNAITVEIGSIEDGVTQCRQLDQIASRVQENAKSILNQCTNPRIAKVQQCIDSVKRSNP